MSGFAPTFLQCSQCGTFHPPVNGPCPMAPIKTAAGVEVSSMRLDNFIANLRVGLVLKLERTKIQDLDKFYLFVSTEMNKLVENYKE